MCCVTEMTLIDANASVHLSDLNLVAKYHFGAAFRDTLTVVVPEK